LTFFHFCCRWMLCVILFAIVLIVNLWGLIGSCNLSGKGIMFFSGAGIITFLVVWALVAFAFVLCLGVSDFCLDPYPTLERFMNDDFSLMLRYFRKCVENKDSVLEGTPLGRLLQQTKDMHIFLARFFMNLKLEGKETSHPEIWTAISGIHDAYAEATKSAVSLYNLVSCSNMREEYKTIRYGLCNESLSANSVLLMALTAFGIIQFVTLLIKEMILYYQERMQLLCILIFMEATCLTRVLAWLLPCQESCNADNTMGGFRNTPPPAYDYGISSLRPRH
ncbi:Protein tweety -like protein 1, partial [Trichinella pseudospiralis]